MRKFVMFPLLSLLCVFSVLICTFSAQAEEKALTPEILPVWSAVAPGAGEEGKPAPTLELFRPEKQTTDVCLLVFPGGSYKRCGNYPKTYRYFNDRGITVVVLKYRVPRREGLPKHLPAWQDAQRAIRVVRANAEKWGINPEKIGALGFSAGGHLALMAGANSETPAYEPIDELDKLPCHLNFAIPAYTGYVVQDGEDDVHTGDGNNSPMVKDFAFDSHTPPMCLLHGDEDEEDTPMGAVLVYHKLRTMGIPAELHIFAKTGHAFAGKITGDHIGTWHDRVFAWMRVMEIVK